MMFMKKNGGFTLVELIVVIAILAILAGVAVPAYSGYVEKANTAADESLLASVNTAFAAACAFNGEDHVGRNGVSASIGNNDVTVSTGVEAINKSFDEFFEGGQFKVMKNLTYKKTLGMFVNVGEIYEVTVNGKTYYASEAAIEAYLKSEIGKNLTPEQITKLAADTAGNVFGLYSGTYVTDLLESGSYSDAVMDIFGMSYQDYMDEQFANWAEGKYNLNDDRERADAVDAWNNGVKKQYDQNLMILASVSQAEKAGETILNDLRSGNGKETIINNLTGSNGATGEQAALGLSQAALAYGLYVSYKGENATVSDFTRDLGDPNSEFNTKYLTGTTVETDLAGVLGAMSVIGDQDKGTLDSVIANGVDKDADLAAALEELLGKK